MVSDPDLVGRSEELAIISTAVAAGRQVVLLSGIAGVGKSSLVRKVLADAGDESSLWISATPALARVPLGAVAQLLPVGVSPTPGVDAATWAGETLLDGASPSRRRLVAIDDAQHLDPQSNEIVVAMLVDPRACVIVIVRSGEALPDRLARALDSADVMPVDLQPLASSDTTALAEQLLGGTLDRASADRLWETTGGNPLFIKELTAAGRERGELTQQAGQWLWSGRVVSTPRIHDLVLDRIETASTDERMVLDLLAIVEPLELATMVAISGRATLDRAKSRGTVTIERDEVRYSHPLYGEVVRSRLEAQRRRDLSGVLAEEMAAQGASESNALLQLVALRFDAGVESDPATLERAARLAITFSDQELAERLARAATDTGAGPAALVHLAEALYWQGRFEESLSIGAAVDLSDATDEVRAQAACSRASALFWGLDDPQRALALLERVETQVTLDAPRAEIAAHRASVLNLTGDGAAARAIAEPILADPPAGSRAHGRAFGPALQAQALAGESDTAVARAIDATELALSLADDLPTAAGGIVVGRFLGLLLAGRANDLEELTRALLDLSRARPGDDFRAIWLFLDGRAALARGRPRTALARGTEAIGMLRARDVGRILPWCLAVTAQAAGQIGDAALAFELAREARATTGSFRVWISEIGLAEAWAASASGERSHARDLAFAAAAEVAQMGQLGSEAFVLLEALRFGGATTARGRLAALADSIEGPLVRLAARRAAATVGQDGLELAAVATDLAALGADLIAAETAAAAAPMLQRAGLYARADAVRHRTADLAARCEGATTVSVGDDALDALTDREREVAALAAQGLARRAIAERLFLSERTVGNHLHRAYSKLGISGAEALRSLFGLDEVSATE